MSRRTPLFTAVAIATLGLGIGANSTIFTFVESILLPSFASSGSSTVGEPEPGGSVNFSYPNYLDFRDRNNTFSSLAACRYVPANVSVRARENFRVWGYEATGNYFWHARREAAAGAAFWARATTTSRAHTRLSSSVTLFGKAVSAPTRT